MEEISLRELIEILIKRKKIIILITILSVLVTGIFNFFVLKPQYEAKITIATFDLEEQLASLQESDNEVVRRILNVISQYPKMNIEAYKLQVKSTGVMERTIKQLKLEKEYTVESLASALNIDANDQTGQMTIKLQHINPKKAAEIVNKVGDEFKKEVESSVKERLSKISDSIKKQMDMEKEKYEKAIEEQKTLFSKQEDANELQQELEAKLEQITNYKIQLNDLEIKRDALESQIKIAEKDPNISNSLILRQGSSIDGTLNLVIDDTEKSLKIELAGVKASINSITNKITEMQKDIDSLQVELQDKMYEQTLVEQKVIDSQNTYHALMEKYEELKMLESSNIGEANITIMSNAHPPTIPISPRKALNMAISLVLGLMIGVFVVFFQEYWESTGKQMNIKG